MYAAEPPRQRQNTDFDWRFHWGYVPTASAPVFAGTSWRLLDVQRVFGAEGKFSSINASGTAFLPGCIAWYRKAVVIPTDWNNKVVSIEFDGGSLNMCMVNC
jgi:beta-galactosidase